MKDSKHAERIAERIKTLTSETALIAIIEATEARRVQINEMEMAGEFEVADGGVFGFVSCWRKTGSGWCYNK